MAYFHPWPLISYSNVTLYYYGMMGKLKVTDTVVQISSIKSLPTANMVVL